MVKLGPVHLDPTNPRGQQRQLPLEEWKIRVNDVYPAYIEWETYLKIRANACATTMPSMIATKAGVCPGPERPF